MRITTYEQLNHWLGSFDDSRTQVLFLVGPKGTGKTRIVRQLYSDYRWITGQATAYSLYLDLQNNRNRNFVLDDPDGLYKNKDCIRILKQWCQTEPTKKITWMNATTMKDGSLLKPEIEVTSRVIIISNDWRRLNDNVGALEDRGRILEFAPSKREIHSYAQTFFTDAEILSFVNIRLTEHRVKDLSLRDYLDAQDAKETEDDWRYLLSEKWKLDESETIFKNLQGVRFTTEGDRAAEWQRLTGMSRGSYYNVRTRLMEE